MRTFIDKEGKTRRGSSGEILQDIQEERSVHNGDLNVAGEVHTPPRNENGNRAPSDSVSDDPWKVQLRQFKLIVDFADVGKRKKARILQFCVSNRVISIREYLRVRVLERSPAIGVTVRRRKAWLYTISMIHNSEYTRGSSVFLECYHFSYILIKSFLQPIYLDNAASNSQLYRTML